MALYPGKRPGTGQNRKGEPNMKKLDRERIAELLPLVLRKAAVSAFFGIAAAALWDRLVNTAGYYDTVEFMSAVLCIFFLCKIWLDFLRLDGVGLPRLSGIRKLIRKVSGGMGDHLNDDLDPYDGVSLAEQDLCSITASLLCAVVFGIVFLFALLF